MDKNQPTTLLGRVREVIRYKHRSIRTERAHVDWIRRFVNFHGWRHPLKFALSGRSTATDAGWDQKATGRIISRFSGEPAQEGRCRQRRGAQRDQQFPYGGPQRQGPVG